MNRHRLKKDNSNFGRPWKPRVASLNTPHWHSGAKLDLAQLRDSSLKRLALLKRSLLDSKADQRTVLNAQYMRSFSKASITGNEASGLSLLSGRRSVVIGLRLNSYQDLVGEMLARVQVRAQTINLPPHAL